MAHIELAFRAGQERAANHSTAIVLHAKGVCAVLQYVRSNVREPR
jgi:hypothetical protein